MTLSVQALVRMHPGRPRLRNRRPGAEKDHKAVEPPEAVRSVAKAYRIKNGALPHMALFAEYESTLGRLKLEGPPSGVDRNQFQAAQRYAALVKQYARILSSPPLTARALDLARPIKGQSCGIDISEDEANQIKSRFKECRKTLLELGQSLGVGSNVNRAVYGIVIEDWPMGHFGTYELQNLRCGLNALERIMKTWDKR